MWHIKLGDKNIKTFSINMVFDFIVKNHTSDYNFHQNYIELSKSEFLKSFLRISKDYDKYLVLEKKLISKESKELWLKITKHSKK